MVEIQGETTVMNFRTREKPTGLVFNAGTDIPVDRERFYTFSNFSDDFAGVIIIYGTARHREAQHTLALRFQKMAADRFTEILLPIQKDSEISDSTMALHDLVVCGNVEDNTVMKRMADSLKIDAGKNYFRWKGKLYSASDEGLFVAAPNPFNPRKTVYLFLGNSAMEIYQMTKTLPRLPSWAVYKKDQVAEKGYHPTGRVDVIP
jgi:hypothetical protein